LKEDSCIIIEYLFFNNLIIDKKMIISFNGDHGSGKSTIAEKVSDALGYSRFYIGQIFRDMAKEKGMTLPEFQKMHKYDSSADKEVDDYVVKLSKENDNFVIESRTAWHFIPNSIKIYLKVSDQEAAERVFREVQNENRKNELVDADSLVEVVKNLQDRKERDDDRYQRYYGINIRDEKNYDFVLDTTGLSIEEVFEKVMDFIKSKIDFIRQI
jgi:cytidylate kinase